MQQATGLLSLTVRRADAAELLDPKLQAGLLAWW